MQYGVSYIADAMYNRSDSELFNIDGILLYDAALSTKTVGRETPLLPFVEYWQGLFNLNRTFMSDIRHRWKKCKYDELLQAAFTFPPKGPIPSLFEDEENPPRECELWVKQLPLSEPTSANSDSRTTFLMQQPWSILASAYTISRTTAHSHRTFWAYFPRQSLGSTSIAPTCKKRSMFPLENGKSAMRTYSKTTHPRPSCRKSYLE